MRISATRGMGWPEAPMASLCCQTLLPVSSDCQYCLCSLPCSYGSSMRCDNRVSNMKASMSFLRLLQFFAVNQAIDNHVDPAYNNLPSFLEGFRVGRIRKLVDQLTRSHFKTRLRTSKAQA